jgi:hypothetical protein
LGIEVVPYYVLSQLHLFPTFLTVFPF